LVGAVAERVLQIVVHAEAGAEDGFCAQRAPGDADAGLREKFCAVVVNSAVPMCGWLEITPC